MRKNEVDSIEGGEKHEDFSIGDMAF